MRMALLLSGLFYGGVALMVTVFSGCGAHLKIGTPEAVRAMGDWDNGQITNSKASADASSAYWESRKQREKEETSRGVTQ